MLTREVLTAGGGGGVVRSSSRAVGWWWQTSGGLAAHRKAHANTCGRAYATGPGSLAEQSEKEQEKQAEETVSNP